MLFFIALEADGVSLQPFWAICIHAQDETRLAIIGWQRGSKAEAALSDEIYTDESRTAVSYEAINN